MRSTYLVCYDICDDKRLKKVFKTMRIYGDQLQCYHQPRFGRPRLWLST